MFGRIVVPHVAIVALAIIGATLVGPGIVSAPAQIVSGEPRQLNSSGSATSRAPRRAARSIRRAATARLRGLSPVEFICTAATNTDSVM